MLKSFFDWLIGVEPISRWALFLMLFGMVVGIATAIKHTRKKALGE